MSFPLIDYGVIRLRIPYAGLRLRIFLPSSHENELKLTNSKGEKS